MGKHLIIGFALASYDFAATAVNQLSLQRNDRVAIISKLGGNRGWWKGLLHGKVSADWSLVIEAAIRLVDGDQWRDAIGRLYWTPQFDWPIEHHGVA